MALATEVNWTLVSQEVHDSAFMKVIVIYSVYMVTTHRPNTWHHGMGSISYNSYSSLVFVEKCWSAPTPSEGDALSQEDNAHPLAVRTKHVQDIQQLSQVAPSLDLSLPPFHRTHIGHDEKITFSIRSPTTSAELINKCKSGMMYCRMTFSRVWSSSWQSTGPMSILR